jgi:hypothetical protein
MSHSPTGAVSVKNESAFQQTDSVQRIRHATLANSSSSLTPQLRILSIANTLHKCPLLDAERR